MLDAPISGSPVTVKQGTASIMVGGSKKAYLNSLEILKCIGPKVSYIGQNSGLAQAVQTKLAINSLLMVGCSLW